MLHRRWRARSYSWLCTAVRWPRSMHEAANSIGPSTQARRFRLPRSSPETGCCSPLARRYGLLIFRRGPEGWPTSGAPALAGSTVYVGLGSGTRLWALDLNNGHVLWSFDTGDRITSAATIDTASVYIATWHGSIFALDRVHGTLRWSYALNTQHNQAIVDGVGGSMALANGRLYVGDYRGSLLCIDAARGRLIWRYATGAQILATPVVTWGQV